MRANYAEPPPRSSCGQEIRRLRLDLETLLEQLTSFHGPIKARHLTLSELLDTLVELDEAAR